MGNLKPVMFLLLSYGIVIWGGGSFVQKILRRVKKLESKEEGAAVAPAAGQTAGEANGEKGCGRYTGYMERFLVFTAFYLRQQTGTVMLLLVVFLLLAKLITLWDYRRSGGKRVVHFRNAVGPEPLGHPFLPQHVSALDAPLGNPRPQGLFVHRPVLLAIHRAMPFTHQ